MQDASVLNEEGTFSDLKNAVLVQNIVGTRALTPNGQEIGRIADLHLDLPTPRVADYILGSGIIDRLRGDEHLIPVAAVRTVGADAIVVEESAK